MAKKSITAYYKLGIKGKNDKATGVGKTRTETKNT